MKKFGVSSRVIFEFEGVRHRGRVTQVLRGSRRIVTDSGRRVQVPVRRLKASPDRVLVLEARLDRSLRSRRQYASMLLQWLAAYGVEVLHERVHTVEDLRRFVRREGKRVDTRFVHVISHGAPRQRGEGAKLHLTFESLDLAKEADVFQGLRGKILVFSCCSVGSDHRAMEAVKEASEAAAVISYRVPVEDSYTNLHEVLLYHRILTTTRNPLSAARDVADLLYGFDVRPREARIRTSAMVAY